MRNYFSKITAAILAAACLSSCGMINDPEEPTQPGAAEDQGLTLTMTLTTGDVATRTDTNADHTEIPDTEAHEAEIGIWTNYNDYRIFMFDASSDFLLLDTGNPTSVEHRRFKLTPSGTGTGIYDVSIQLPYRYNNPGTYRITTVVMANLEGAFGSYPTAAEVRSMIMGNGPLNPIFQLYKNGASWRLGERYQDPDRLCLIPMYGRKDLTFTVTQETGESVDLGSMGLLRALAKIEVVDCLADDKDSYPKITNIAMNNAYFAGYLIPNNYRDGYQVTSPTVYLNDYMTTTLSSTKGTGSFEVTEGNRESRNFFRFYMPEYNAMMIADPVLAITYETAQGKSSTTQIKLNTLKNPEMTGDQKYSTILRNHIYRIFVERPAAATPTLRWTVCEWTQYEADIPTFQRREAR